MHVELPSILCLNEAWLDKSVESLDITGSVCLSRRDRPLRKGGGVAVYARSTFSSHATPVLESPEYERVWLLVHADIGPILLCNWYRPQAAGEVGSISSFETEWLGLSTMAIGTVRVGDLN